MPAPGSSGWNGYGFDFPTAFPGFNIGPLANRPGWPLDDIARARAAAGLPPDIAGGSVPGGPSGGGTMPGVTPYSAYAAPVGAETPLRGGNVRQRNLLTEPLRSYAADAAQIGSGAFRSALDASRGSYADLDFADRARAEYLRTMEGAYTRSPYIDAEAGRAADVAQRGIAGQMRRFGGGAYAAAILDARRRGAESVYARERGIQANSLGLAPALYDVANAGRADAYRALVADPARLATGYAAALRANPLTEEGRSRTKDKRRGGGGGGGFDWGGFLASAGNDLLNYYGGGGGGGGATYGSGSGGNPGGGISFTWRG